jgi:hypothetical protein
MSAMLAVCVQKYPRVAFNRDITPHRIAFSVSSIRLVREAAMPWTIACSESTEKHSSPTLIRQSPVSLGRHHAYIVEGFDISKYDLDCVNHGRKISTWKSELKDSRVPLRHHHMEKLPEQIIPHWTCSVLHTPVTSKFLSPCRASVNINDLFLNSAQRLPASRAAKHSAFGILSGGKYSPR